MFIKWSSINYKWRPALSTKTAGTDLAELTAAHLQRWLAAAATGQFGLGSFDVWLYVSRANHEHTTSMQQTVQFATMEWTSIMNVGFSLGNDPVNNPECYFQTKKIFITPFVVLLCIY